MGETFTKKGKDLMLSNTIPAPEGLRINLLETPTALDGSALRVSFLPACPTTACRVVVAEGMKGIGDARYIYDSGKLDTAACTGIAPAGLTDRLTPGRLYYARVSAWDSEGVESPLSEPLSFTVGIDWLHRSGVWAGKRPDGALPNFAFFRHDFFMDETDLAEVDRIYLSVTALSPEPTRQYVYNVSVNGTEVGVGPCRLGKTPTGEVTVRYATYDVTACVRAGANVLSAICYTTAEHAFLCQLTAFGWDGAPRVITNTGFDREDWLALDGDAIFGQSNSIGTSYFTAHACNIDGTSYPFGYDTKECYGVDGRYGEEPWHVCDMRGDVLAGRPLLPDETEPMRRYPSAAPVTVTVLPDGGTLVDLGAELVGGLALRVNNPTDAPVTLTLTYGEQLLSDGAGGTVVKFPMNTGNRYRECWTLKRGVQTLETLSMMTYRYIRIDGLPAPLSPADVEGRELRKGFSETDASLSTDHALLTDLWALTRHTVRVTTQDIYVDSQSRERGAYEGDLYINMLAAYAHEASYAPARLTTDYLLGHRTWPADYLLCIIYAARADYRATGDDRLITAWYDRLKANLFTDGMDETGLIQAPPVGPNNGNAILVDWPPSERDGYEMSVTYNTVLNAMIVQALADMAIIADALGKTEDAVAFRYQWETLRATLIDRLYNPVTGRFCDGLYADGTPSTHSAQHATAYALWAGLYTDAAMANRMAEAVFGDGKLHVSVYAAFFLLEGLYRAGRGELANRLLLDPDVSDGARTWAYMLRRMGATITTEAWNETNKPNMTLSHPWGAAPAHMIASGICGITPTSAGYATMDICPAFAGISPLDHFDATVPTIRGGVRVLWQAEPSGTHALTLSLPAGTIANVTLPDGRRIPNVCGKTTWTGM